MTPDQPVDDLAARHLVAVLLLAVDALGTSVERLAFDRDARAAGRVPDEIDLALLGLVALAGHVRAAATAMPVPVRRTRPSQVDRWSSR